MRKDSSIPGYLFAEANDLLEDPGLRGDLLLLINQVKNKSVWKKGELSAKILLISPDMRIVLTALHPGTEIDSFQSDSSVFVQILSGKLEFHTRKNSLVLEKGQSLMLYENINYRLIAQNLTVFLLTVITGSNHTREKDITMSLLKSFAYNRVRVNPLESRKIKISELCAN